jgi:hypothetical protein
MTLVDTAAFLVITTLICLLSILQPKISEKTPTKPGFWAGGGDPLVKGLLGSFTTDPRYTVKGADIKCYQITMSTCTVAILQILNLKMASAESGGAN